jgi:hypothetical protein
MFPAFADIAAALQEVWPWGEMAEVAEVRREEPRREDEMTAEAVAVDFFMRREP